MSYPGNNSITCCAADGGTLTVTLCLTSAQFRAIYPAFADTVLYTDFAIDYWIAIGTILLNYRRWGRLLGYGLGLFVAHNLALQQMQLQTAAAGGVGGLAKGPIASETPGSVSLSYAVDASAEPGGGYYNYTVYGQAFIRYARLMGAGVFYIGVGQTPPGAQGLNNTIYNGPAWNGPWNGPEGPGWGT